MSSTSLLPLAHVASDLSWSATQWVVVAVVIGFAGWLVLQHYWVKHGRLPVARTIALVALAALGATVAPTPGFAQSTIGPMGLPDLISDPPFIWIERDLNDVDGEVIRVLSFDGFLHNIGEGSLDLAGNPQIEGGVKQRVFDGENWEDVGEPLVRFETDDGHNHFHLINAAAYSLWNEAQTEQVEIGSKIGFCLLDTFQVERGVEAQYLIDEVNYCNANDPESTDLRMGISPGWVDLYEATITLQWVDVSNTIPGRYWIGAIIDPNNEIVESNEDNNGLVFSANKYAVSGYVARELPTQTQPEITLKSRMYGTVGQVAYVIVDPPARGTLSVPTGVDVLDPNIRYTSESGYTGTDSFSYYAHDTSNAFPFDPHVVTVELEASDITAATVAEQTELPSEAEFQIESAPISATRYESINLQLGLITPGEATAQATWYAKDLPAGLTIDPAVGLISGELVMPDDKASTIVVRFDNGGETVDFETRIDWKIEDRERASLRALNDFSTILDRRDILVGAGTAETTYEATGLPDGVVLTEGQPSILGIPTETGDFDIVVNELLDGEIVDTVSFTMTVRGSAKPEFVL
jgi:hypothetical protein